MNCGYPAVYFGTLHIATVQVLSKTFPPALVDVPFCEECTRTPGGWHRTFVSDRPALPGEACQVPL